MLVDRGIDSGAKLRKKEAVDSDTSLALTGDGEQYEKLGKPLVSPLRLVPPSREETNQMKESLVF